MNAENPVGFWSYSHRDDELDGGRIRRLAESIAGEFELITGERLRVFVDNRSISWGEVWRERINTALTSTTFLIPVITPAFLRSKECRREVTTFSRHAENLGLQQLLLPIYYSNVPQLRDNAANDELISLITARQRVDWRELRLEDETSARYRRAVHELAVRLSGIVEDAATPPPPPVPVDEGDDPPGVLETMAEMESALPAWQRTIENFTAAVLEVTELSSWATGEMERSDARGAGFSGRVRIAQELADRLRAPAEEMESLGAKYTDELHTIHAGIFNLLRGLESGPQEVRAERDAREFLEQLGILIDAAKGINSHLEGFAGEIREAAGSSRHIRPLMNTVGAAVQQVLDGRSVIGEWRRALDGLTDEAGGALGGE
ncbi:toll/interleukin-1 receptor domain-containing protein [Streptomyces clavuligerus]|uniref:TIR protein n=1 Tax=Streptomyces clavuligerus TaxID=1901 RepID=B5GY23_STRCL|nr:toll/interleukin-1 receptor domain-containing protein [Streptomyces clavuligerus]ANW19538.1 molecular chaperone Tir [Streptomyces clavuligerus]AXU14144.1 toll/interleukin-1 receptor domain-containing protein [Streptomyces clavuligerus]EDY51219.1 hypothetical protein SSCG_04303 [Streptomyces clavuligerus]EFG07655.1 TIR protein [Streptomyces clavuligerus]MBY6304137.1 toll/interleukin-1 receptor domain-containing protein [Streptomyces clavuligerus]